MNILFALMGIILALAALVPLATKWLRGRERVIAANTYDAAVETHLNSIQRTNDVAVTARHLLWTYGATPTTTVKLATVALPAIGTIDTTETATAVPLTVLLLGNNTTRKMVARGVITAGDRVYQAAAGKVAATGTIQVGFALTTTAADNDILEVQTIVPVVNGSRILAAAETLTAAESGAKYYLNAAGGFNTTLPANAGLWEFEFIVMTAPTTAYVITAATADTIAGYPVASLGSDETGNGNTAGDVINFVANTALPGDSVKVSCNGVTVHATCIGKATGAITITG